MGPRYERLVQDCLVRTAGRLPDKVALVAHGEAHTYGELLGEAMDLASALQHRGLRRGDRVAVFMNNCWPAVVSIYGTLLAGGVMMVLHSQTKVDKLAFLLQDSVASFLLTEKALAGTAVQASRRAPTTPPVLCAGLGNETQAGMESWEAALASAPAPGPASQAIPLDLAALIYTSGSTGTPKGVMMSHQSMVFTVGSLVEYLRLDEHDRILNVLPLAFDYGLYQLLMSVHLGATLVLEPSFAFPASTLRRMAEQRVTVLPGVPTLFAAFLSQPPSNRPSMPYVECVTNTAAHLPESHIPGIREMFPNARIYKMYGLTECKRVCFLPPELVEEKPGSVGKAIPGTEVIVLDDHGDPVGPGEIGILHVRGPHVMLGYWNRPELTSMMLRDGPVPGERMLCTHDSFRIDDEGFLYFVGRNDDIIKTRGEKVSPLEIEEVLHAVPGVKEAAVVGVPDGLLGEAVHAYVVKADGVELSELQVKRACAERLENYLIPKKVVFVHELPKTANQKVRKQSLREAV